MVLAPQDVEYLSARGVSVGCAERYGLRSATADEVRDLLGRTDLDAGALLFPYPQRDGEAPLMRVRLHRPLTAADGKTIRYLQARNTPIRPFVTALAAKYARGLRPLVITEGEAKALAAEEAGFAAVGIPGCWGWVAPRPSTERKPAPTLHPAFDAFRLRGRRLYLVPDSDVVSTLDVRRAFLAFAEQLQKRGAAVFLALLPVGPAGEKIGVDDLLAQNGADALELLLAGAPQATPRAVGAYIKRHQLDRPLALERSSTVRICRVRWWWEDRVPLGMISLIVGPPGLGKTLIVLDRIARASRGQLPGNLDGIPTTALVCSTEDHRASVLVPRLMAAGADLERVFFLSGPDGGAFTLPEQLPALRQAVLRVGGARVVLIDPLSPAFSAKVNTWRDADIRRVLAPLSALAEEMVFAPIGVMHVNRRETSDVLARISGSGAFGAMARSVLLVTPDPDDPAHRLASQAKLSVGTPGPSLRFRIEGRTVDAPDGPMTTAAVVWAGASDLRAETLLAPPAPEERGAFEEAMAFLREEVIAQGEPVPAKEVWAAAKQVGIAEPTLKRAKRQLRIGSRKVGRAWHFTPPREEGQKEITPPHIGPLDPLDPLPETRVTQGEQRVRVSRGSNVLDVEENSLGSPITGEGIVRTLGPVEVLKDELELFPPGMSGTAAPVLAQASTVLVAEGGGP